MAVSDQCRWVGSQTLRVCDQFQGISRAIEGRSLNEALIGINLASETLKAYQQKGVLSQQNTQEYIAALAEIREDLNWDRHAKAHTRAGRLADDIGWEMLNKLVDCECTAVKGQGKIAEMESLLDTLSEVCQTSTTEMANRLQGKGIRSWDDFKKEVL